MDRSEVTELGSFGKKGRPKIHFVFSVSPVSVKLVAKNTDIPWEKVFSLDFITLSGRNSRFFASFETDKNSVVFLNKIGKRIFIKELEKKLYQKVKIDGISRTHDAIIRNEI